MPTRQLSISMVAAEFDALGISFNSRGKAFDEGVDAIKRLWTQDDVSFHGQFYQFDNVTVTPKPVQTPHPPIWIGSWTGSRPAARRIVKHAAGWQASALHGSLEQAVLGWQNIEEMCAEMGRDPATITRSLVNQVVRVGASRAQAIANIPPSHRMHEELIIAGPPNALCDRLLAIYATGIEEISLFMPLDAVEQVDLIAERVLPELQGAIA